MRIDFTHEQGVILSDLIRAAAEVREKGELYTRGDDALILLPYPAWRRLAQAVQAWEDERDGKKEDVTP